MKHLPRFGGAMILLCLLVSLVAFAAQQVNSHRSQQEAKAGVDALIAQLPDLQFETIKVVFEESYDVEHGGGPICYYARAYVFTGSTLPESEALEVYYDKLQSLGWIPRDKQYETERILRRGINERAVVRLGTPGFGIDTAVDYTQLLKLYKSVIVVRLDYTLPSRDGC